MTPTNRPTRRALQDKRHFYLPGYGKRLESARLAKGLSQAQAIHYTHHTISPSALSLAEQEQREISIDKLDRLAGLYGVRLVWLTHGTGPRMISEPDEVEELDDVPDPLDAPEGPMELTDAPSPKKRRPKRA